MSSLFSQSIACSFIRVSSRCRFGFMSLLARPSLWVSILISNTFTYIGSTFTRLDYTQTSMISLLKTTDYGYICPSSRKQCQLLTFRRWSINSSHLARIFPSSLFWCSIGRKKRNGYLEGCYFKYNISFFIIRMPIYKFQFKLWE